MVKRKPGMKVPGVTTVEDPLLPTKPNPAPEDPAHPMDECVSEKCAESAVCMCMCML